MNILLLAPEPFYQDRGTPIAVGLVLTELSERGDHVEVITYHEGREIEYQNVTVHRIVNVSFIRNVRPGFSWQKLMCDCLMFCKALRLAYRKHYDLVHAVEESVFIALVLKWTLRIPYVYDMDSALAEQMIEKYPFLTVFKRVLKYCERIAVRNAEAVMPVCEALADIIKEYNPKKVTVVPDVSLLKNVEPHSS